jgi:uncharacterized protein YndB with AHSA1/START domain
MIEVINQSLTTLTMKRRFNSTAERVFDAWLNPEMMSKWFFTSELTNKVTKNDPRIGGTWEIVSLREGIEYRAIGEYIEINRSSRLVFTFQMPQFSKTTDTITVEIQPLEKGCEMTFTQDIVVPHEENWTSADIEKAEKEYRDSSEHGWGLMFGGLNDILGLHELVKHIGVERIGSMNDLELKAAADDYLKNQDEQILPGFRYLGYVEHEAVAFTDLGLKLIKQLSLE